MDELKACPFCGGEAAVCQSHYNGKWFVACLDEPEHNVGHFENGGRYLTKEEAVNEWNRRSASENKPLTPEELRKRLGKPVWMIDGAGNSAYGIVNCDGCADSDYGKWDIDFYNMHGDGEHGLHRMGWIAYAHKSEGADPT